MNRTIMIAAACLLLAACGPSPEEIAKVKAALPQGCTFHDLGSYGSLEHLIIIDCDGRPTHIDYYVEPHAAGKTVVHHRVGIVWIE